MKHIPNYGALYGEEPYHAHEHEVGRWVLADFNGAECYGAGRNTFVSSAETVEEIIRAYGYTPAPRRMVSVQCEPCGGVGRMRPVGSIRRLVNPNAPTCRACLGAGRHLHRGGTR